jgi:hypothetical protein
MAISIKKYVPITSGVAGGSPATRRELILRIFTTNPLLPTNSLIDFTDSSQAAAFFGDASVEFYRSRQYFSFISKDLRSPQKISFARWVDADVAPIIFGAKITTTLLQFSAITTGSFALEIGGVSHDIIGLDFSAVITFADVAQVLQNAIRAADAAVQWTSATVTYDATRKAFNFVGGETGASEIEVSAASSGLDVRSEIGWTDFARYSDGADTQSITAVLTDSADTSNNFGSFVFIPTLTLDQILEAGLWNYARNVEFVYHVPVELSDTVDYSAELIGVNGLGLTLYDPDIAEYPEQLPCQILAATDYSKPSAVQNYMYQQANLTATVDTTSLSDSLDVQRVNYMGQTQEAGNLLTFYQRGLLCGLLDTDIIDMGVYANEIWLKDSMSVAILSLLLAQNEVPANSQGVAMIQNILQGQINTAIANGTISVGKFLTDQQKQKITQISGSDIAWYQVQTTGYWVSVDIVETSVAEFEARYLLIYSKNDVIRRVSGTHVLI